MERRPSKKLVPVVAVPYMGETGRRLCAEAGVSWIDLSGNAWIDAPAKQIRILGNRNRFAPAGRPANVFAPRSSRLVRALLMQPRRVFSQAELVSASGVDKGRVSRLVHRMLAMDLLVNEGEGYRLKDPGVALEAWREAYDFRKHQVLEGHVPVRDPDDLLEVAMLDTGRYHTLAERLRGRDFEPRTAHIADTALDLKARVRFDERTRTVEKL